MSDDLVKRLREGTHRICAYGGVSPCVTCAERTEAADEIERLRETPPTPTLCKHRDGYDLCDKLAGHQSPHGVEWTDGREWDQAEHQPTAFRIYEDGMPA